MHISEHKAQLPKATVESTDGADWERGTTDNVGHTTSLDSRLPEQPYHAPGAWIEAEGCYPGTRTEKKRGIAGKRCCEAGSDFEKATGYGRSDPVSCFDIEPPPSGLIQRNSQLVYARSNLACRTNLSDGRRCAVRAPKDGENQNTTLEPTYWCLLEADDLETDCYDISCNGSGRLDGDLRDAQRWFLRGTWCRNRHEE